MTILRGVAASHERLGYSLAKVSSIYACQSCGAVTSRWVGRCESCGSWNSVMEESQSAGIGPTPARPAPMGKARTLQPLNAKTDKLKRTECGVGELDRVFGGGLVPGSAILVGGDPGIGKSTLLLQCCAAMAQSGAEVVYVSGEEALDQVRLRAQRLQVLQAPVMMLAETCVEDIVATLKQESTPSLIIIDSIQTLWTSAVDASPGTVSQVRAAAQLMIRYAKQSGASVIFVGHVTKDGQIAGPRVVEHMVDAVFYFEGDRNHDFRVLKAVKNRFGATDEIGVFAMGNDGLKEVPNPSEIFLGERDSHSSGAAIFAGMEGSRPLLVEIQALVAPSPLGTPRRAVVGWDSARLSMLLAVLEARCGLKMGTNDVFLNVAGGLKLTEPAADLAFAAALVSALSGSKLPMDRVYFGEVSLSGAVRAASHAAARLKEAERLGFRSAITPVGGMSEVQVKQDFSIHSFSQLSELVAQIISSAKSPERQTSKNI